MNQQTLVDARSWFKAFGLRFDPFAHLEASADPYLLRYIVTPFDLRPVWDDANALILAPVGGGKTALRLYSAWNSLRGLFSYFPISYVLQQEGRHLPSSDIRAHGHSLARISARGTLLLLASFPHVFLELSQRDQSKLVDLLASMTDEYEWLLELWQDETWETLMEMLVESAILNTFAKPRGKDIEKVRLVLEKATPFDREDPFEVTRRVFGFLIDRFNYRSIHILLDGVDGFPETSSQASNGARWLRLWMEGFISVFPPESVRLKVFIPSEMDPFQGQYRSSQPATFQRAEITWNRANLVEVLRRRIFIASDRMYETLNGLCSDEIDDIEEILVETILRDGRPLPRELLALMQEIVRAHILNDPEISYFTVRDVEAGISTYRERTFGKTVPAMALS